MCSLSMIVRWQDALLLIGGLCPPCTTQPEEPFDPLNIGVKDDLLKDVFSTHHALFAKVCMLFMQRLDTSRGASSHVAR